jgi:2-polyprenyl-3-methyl-5-hydroxy-6-metoxy-1,4-benzoquinol methylase
LADRGWNVTGIENDPQDATEAERVGLRVLQGKAQEVLPEVSDRFGIVVLADVLEHFADPLEVLRAAAGLLEPGGRVVISVPNVAHLSVRLQLLLGSFDYTDRGILDRTHLRFFTRKTLKVLVADAGLKMRSLGATPAPVEEVFPVLLRVRWLHPLLAAGSLLARAWKSMFAYQFLIVADRVEDTYR